MEPAELHMPGYRINEYKIVLNPNEELGQRIIKLREEFGEKYRINSSRFIRPNITLVNFSTWEMMEERIIQRLQAIAMGIIPFKVELKDYGSFPTHSIFINVTSRLPVQQIVSELKTAQKLMKLNNEYKPHFIDDPYITLASKLKPWQYDKGWLDYSRRHFTGRFIADSMLLLKRRAGEKNSFQILRRLEFLNLPVSTRQGSLFV